MTRSKLEAALAVAVLAASAVALSGCGKRGPLETPPPLFGEHNKARYEAQQRQQEQDAADAAARRGNRTTPAADQPDNAPRTTRDVKAPEQNLTPASRHPIDGSSPSPFGAPPSNQPPG